MFQIWMLISFRIKFIVPSRAYRPHMVCKTAPRHLAPRLLPTTSPLFHSAPAPLIHFLLLRCSGHLVALGPLRLQSPLVGMLFLHYPLLVPSLHSGLCLKLTLSLRAEGTHLATCPCTLVGFLSISFHWITQYTPTY